MGKTKSARIDDEELLYLLEERGQKIEGGSSEVMRRALRDHLYEENFGLSDDDYGALIEGVGDYFHELMQGDPQEAFDIGDDIYDIDEEWGEAVAKITVYMEENGWV